MAATHVQNLVSSGNSTASQTSLVLSPSGKTVTAGNTIVVGFGCYFDITPSGIEDNLGNTYTRVERLYNPAHPTADLWYAPVTSGGSITSITISFASTQYIWAIASEFAGLAASPAVGGGTTGSTSPGTIVQWVTNKTIPANGLAVGVGSTANAPTPTVGAASGSPSTSISLSGTWVGDIGGSLAYAIAGGSDVTGFTGTTEITTSGGDWAGAGALFEATSLPVWTTPDDGDPMSTTPELKFTIPFSTSAQHFQLQLDTADTFDTEDLRTYDSSVSQTDWAYWDGDSWEAIPEGGVATDYIGNEARYTVTDALSSTTWYRRVRAGSLA